MKKQKKKVVTFGVQHSRYVQIFFGHIESQVQILQRVVLEKWRGSRGEKKKKRF